MMILGPVVVVVVEETPKQGDRDRRHRGVERTKRTNSPTTTSGIRITLPNLVPPVSGNRGPISLDPHKVAVEDQASGVDSNVQDESLEIIVQLALGVETSGQTAIMKRRAVPSI
jgi:hypothetical protein